MHKPVHRPDLSGHERLQKLQVIGNACQLLLQLLPPVPYALLSNSLSTPLLLEGPAAAAACASACAAGGASAAGASASGASAAGACMHHVGDCIQVHYAVSCMVRVTLYVLRGIARKCLEPNWLC